MLLRDSMRVLLTENSSRREIAFAISEWFVAAVVCCLVLGLLDDADLARAVLAGLLTGIILTCVLLIIRRVFGNANGKS